jgi:hypothetical protein
MLATHERLVVVTLKLKLACGVQWQHLQQVAYLDSTASPVHMYVSLSLSSKPTYTWQSKQQGKGKEMKSSRSFLSPSLLLQLILLCLALPGSSPLYIFYKYKSARTVRLYIPSEQSVAEFTSAREKPADSCNCKPPRAELRLCRSIRIQENNANQSSPEEGRWPPLGSPPAPPPPAPPSPWQTTPRRRTRWTWCAGSASSYAAPRPSASTPSPRSPTVASTLPPTSTPWAGAGAGARPPPPPHCRRVPEDLNRQRRDLFLLAIGVEFFPVGFKKYSVQCICCYYSNIIEYRPKAVSDTVAK